MALIFAGIALVITIVLCLFIMEADEMSSAPSVQSISPIPVLIMGLVVTGILVAIHFAPHL